MNRGAMAGSGRTEDTAAPPRPRLDPTSRRVRPGAAFTAMLWRDTFVTGTELVTFLLQVLLQPFFLLFVFGKVLGDLGYTQGNFEEVLLPGIVALTAFLTALQNTAFPLVIDFSYTKEIEDRLMAPIPTTMVAVEKMVFASLRALLSAALMFPIGYLVLGSISLSWSNAPMVVVFLVLGSFVGSAIGITLGTLVTAQRINIVFAVVLTPLLFTGATQFPWPELTSLRWFQVVCAFNPLTYASEGLRAQLVPDVPHISTWVCLLALTGFLALFATTGVIGFRRRALD